MLLKIGDVERSKEYLVRSVELSAVSDNLYTLGEFMKEYWDMIGCQRSDN